MTLRAAALAAVLAMVFASAGCKKDEGCDVGKARCGDSCVDPLTDPGNCGNCGVRCAAGEACCGGTCRNTSTDPLACGGCGKPCFVGAPCEGGVCGSCPQELPDPCPPSGPPGACVNLQTGAGGYCGTCGLTCAGTGVSPPDAVCSNGACECTGAARNCGGNPQCVALQTDPYNCGACSYRCTVANAVCVGGTCTCPGGLTECGTACVNTQTDARNCGGCGTVCPLTNDVCADGHCACPTSLPDTCGNSCVNLRTDPRYCGTCETACPLGASCAAGLCQCPASLPDVCGGACVDRRTDEANCGACGVPCGANQACTDGTCCGAGAPVCGGTCCAGDACCAGGACETEHSNGVGQHYYDCNPLGTYSAASAQAAARAWRSTGTVAQGLLCASPDCIGWQTATSCGVWCYGNDAWGARVTVNEFSIVCVCPTLGPAQWN